MLLYLAPGEVILESAILTAVVVISLTLYTFWAARRGHDFNFLGPFLFGAVMVLLVFAFIQVHEYACSASFLKLVLTIILHCYAFLTVAAYFLVADSISVG